MTTLRLPSVVMLFLAVLVSAPCLQASGQQAFPLTKTSTCEFQTAEQASEFLSADDDFTRTLSDLDRKGRMEEVNDASRDAFLRFLGRQAREWTGPEVNKVRSALERLGPRLEELGVKLPAKILLIKTSGKEEFDKPYTRRNALVLTQAFLQRTPAPAMMNTLAAELFTLMTRNDPSLQGKLYGLIGFKQTGEPSLPRRWSDRQFTDPDFPRNDASVEVAFQRRTVRVIPLLVSKDKVYDPRRVPDLSKAIDLRLAVLDERDPTILKLGAGDEPVFLDPRQVTGYPNQATANTTHNNHPQEVLADNFTLLVMQRKAPNQKLLDDIAAVLKGGTPSGTAAAKPAR
ncbi:MAG: hypothetical protein IT442_08215 [Phycisphaeraceae bacterium]|nr:hypothetical protein [Phycisphaeraceae bacterium]